MVDHGIWFFLKKIVPKFANGAILVKQKYIRVNIELLMRNNTANIDFI